MLENEKPVQKDKLQDQLYERLCMRLREGQFTPGKPIQVARIADAFAVSAMPVREALTRLVAIGVLTNVSGRSVGVPSMQMDELTDLRNVRLEVETLALRWGVQNRDRAFEEDLEKLLSRLEETEQAHDIPGYIKTNYDFHFRLYRQSGSTVLTQLIDTLWLRVSPHLYQLEREDQFKVSNEHHRAIVRAVCEGDSEGAAAALANDLMDAYDVLVRSLALARSNP